MDNRKNSNTSVYPGIILVLALVLTIRLIMAFYYPNFTYDAYLTLRHVESIKANLLPVYNDTLSYGGRHFVFLPIFSYLLAIFTYLFPIWWVAKILPNLFAVLNTFIIYLVLEHVTHKKYLSMFMAFCASIFPLLLISTTNSTTVNNLALPYLFACVYYYLRVQENINELPKLLLLIIFFPFIHLTALFFIFGLLCYLLLSAIEGLAPKKLEFEILVFSTFYMAWVLFLFFKKAFLVHGFWVIWQNAPEIVLEQYFEPITLLSSFGAVGVLPIILSILIVYKYVTQKCESVWYIFIGFVLSFFILISLKLVDLNTGFIYLGTFLFILSGQFFSLALDYIYKTKFSKYKLVIIPVFGLFFLLSLFLFSTDIERDTPDAGLIKALSWVKHNTLPDATVLGTLNQGYLISYLSQRKNVWDNSFLLVPNIEQRVNDITELLQTSIEVRAIELLSKYRIRYILFTDDMQKQYNAKDNVFTNDPNCFPKVYDTGDVKIYKVGCGVREV